MDMPEEITAWVNNGKYFRNKGDYSHPIHYTDRADYTRTDKYDELKELCARLALALQKTSRWSAGDDGEVEAITEYTNFMKDKG